MHEISKAYKPRVYASKLGIHVLCDNPIHLQNEMYIYNTSGQLVSQYRLLKQNNNIVPIQLPKGLYVILIKYEGTPQAYKLLIS